MSVCPRFSSCKWFLFMEETEHTELRKMKRVDSPALHPLDLTVCGQFTFCPPVTPLQRTQAQGVWPVSRTEDALKEGSLPLMAYCSAACPVLIPAAKEVELNCCWFLSGEVLFCFISSHSLCKMFHNKLFLYYLVAAICEHTGRAWCINVGIHSSPPAWSEILPNTHTEGCWFLRLCSTFTALAVLKFN